MRQSARAMYGQLEDAFTSMSTQLRSVLLDTLGFAAAVEWHVRHFQRCTGVPCAVSVDNATGLDLPEVYAAALFDIYHDALGNAVRHAGASRVAIALTITPREVAVVVLDNEAGPAVTVHLPIA